MGIVRKASFKCSDTIKAPDSIILETFLIDSILKCRTSTYSFSFVKCRIILKAPIGYGFKEYWRMVLLEFHYLFLLSFFFSIFFLISLFKIYISVLFLRCLNLRYQQVVGLKIYFQTMLYYTTSNFQITSNFQNVI